MKNDFRLYLKRRLQEFAKVACRPCRVVLRRSHRNIRVSLTGNDHGFSSIYSQRSDLFMCRLDTSSPITPLLPLDHIKVT